MPSTSKKQHNFMAAIANNSSFAKKVGIPQSVGKDFSAADKGRKFNKGGAMKRYAMGGETKLADDETMLAPYEKLSEGKRAKMTVERAKNFNVAESERKRPIGSRILDAMYENHPLVDEKTKKFMRDRAGADSAKREDRYLKAAEEQDNPILRKGTLYADDVPHKFKKGGNVKESKEMVGKEMMFMKKKGAPASMIKHEKAEMGMKKGGMAHGGMHKMPDGKMMKNSAMKEGGMAGTAKTRKFEGGGKVRTLQDAMADHYPNAERKNEKDDAALEENFANAKKQIGEKDYASAAVSGAKGVGHGLRSFARRVPMVPGAVFNEARIGAIRGAREMVNRKDKDMEAGFKKGGMPMKDGKPAFMMGKKKMMGGGMAKYAKGGGIESRGKTKGTMIRMAAGGSVGSASRRADGIAQRGKTRG